ncbi:MarR family transcriptional regulator [Mycobacterium sp.]|uniref:MarR family transcriptional regulator n=1 Tax=Mycobacterium sp. TaxID=1785 RepID=UPI003BA88920
MNDLAVLQAVRLKGRVSHADLVGTLEPLGESPANISATVQQLTASGQLVDSALLRISPSGRARLDALLTEELTSADPAALASAYDQFRSVNADFKAVVTDWQLKDGQPNAHQDAEYDTAILARLDGIHRRMTPIIAAAAAQLPRLKAYPVKLRAALDKIELGEHRWLTRPLIDSYHTVWFELHEELIRAAGLTREEAARSGDAQ